MVAANLIPRALLTSRRLGLLAVAAAIVVAGCSGSSSGKSSTAKEGGLLRLGTIGTISSMNPFVSEDTLASDFFTEMYPKLVQYNLATLQLEPAFATSWKRSADGLTWTFTTRADATWSDGAPLTARDAAWTITTMVKYQKTAAALWASAIAGVASATAPSATTLVVHYSSAVSNALSQLQQIPILPQHIWQKYAVGNGMALTKVPNVPSASTQIISGGPFIFSKYVVNEVALFKRNPHYWGQKPYIDGFGAEYFANDDAEVAALKAGEIDAALGNPNLPPTDIHPLAAAGFRIVERPGVAFNDFIINTNPLKTANRELLNPLVREAFEYAIDRTTIDRVAFLGYARAGASIVPPATGKWSDPAIHPLPYNIAAANRLLNQAGYAMGSNGVRIANGHPMSYSLLLSPDNGGAGLRTAQIMATDYRKIGVLLQVKVLDDAALNNAIYADHYRSFDLAMWGWDTYIDPSYILSVVTCQQYYNLSDSGYCNPTYDKLYQEQATETNAAKRLGIVYQMQEMLFNDRPYIILQYLDALEAWSRHWSAPLTSPDGFLTFFSTDGMTQIHRV